METTSKETIFYQDGAVKVTQARFVTSVKTYAMSNISSVSLHRIARSKVLDFLMIFFGFVMLFSDSTRMFGIVILAGGIALMLFLKDSYSVRINSNSGEADGLISKNKDYVNKIVDAVNEAIVQRG